MKKSKTQGPKFALYKYNKSTNIGDEIQSIAARRFLPRVDYLIDRDSVGNWSLAKQKDKLAEEVKLIANAWYMSEPFAWPIQEPKVHPLPISMHIETEISKARDAFSKPESIDYLKHYQPIGCRDVSTERFLQGLGIETYFSGCLTLTLQKDPFIKKEKFILAAGVSDAIYDKIKRQTDRMVIRVDSHNENDDSFLVAEKYLYLYQSAHCVVTSRLHAMLPSLALETPVLFLSDGAMTASTSRFEGLGELTNNMSESEYTLEPLRYDINNPPVNPVKYKMIRSNLINKCKKFTGYDDNDTFARHIDFKEFNLSDCLDLILYNQEYLTNRRAQSKDMQIDSLRQENKELRSNTQSVKRSFNQFAESLRYYAERNIFHR